MPGLKQAYSMKRMDRVQLGGSHARLDRVQLGGSHARGSNKPIQ